MVQYTLSLKNVLLKETKDKLPTGMLPSSKRLRPQFIPIFNVGLENVDCIAYPNIVYGKLRYSMENHWRILSLEIEEEKSSRDLIKSIKY